MKLRTIAAIALAALLVTAGAAAATPGQAPDGSGAEHAQADDHRPEQAGDDRDGDHNGTATDDGDGEDAGVYGPDERAANAGGPPADLPGRVPDHVARIHELVAQFLNGDLEGPLGPAIADVTPDEGSEERAGAA